MLHAEEFIRGNPQDEGRPFHYYVLKLNLPGQQDSLPSLPWVNKWRSHHNCMANDFFTYVDDVQTTGANAKECW